MAERRGGRRGQGKQSENTPPAVPAAEIDGIVIAAGHNYTRTLLNSKGFEPSEVEVIYAETNDILTQLQDKEHGYSTMVILNRVGALEAKQRGLDEVVAKYERRDHSLRDALDRINPENAFATESQHDLAESAFAVARAVYTPAKSEVTVDTAFTTAQADLLSSAAQPFARRLLLTLSGMANLEAQVQGNEALAKVHEDRRAAIRSVLDRETTAAPKPDTKKMNMTKGKGAPKP